MPRISFNWQISIGNLISVATVLFVSTVAWVNLSRDVAEHEKRLTVLEGIGDRVGARQAELDVMLAEFRVSMRHLDSLLQEVRGSLRDQPRRPQE